MDDSVKIYIGFSQGTSFTSRLIRWFQFGNKNTHAFYIMSDENNIIDNIDDPLVIESNPDPILSGGGIRIGRFFSDDYLYHNKDTVIKIFYVETTIDLKNKFEKFLLDKIDVKYDFRGIFGIIFKSRVSSKDKYFCSELIYDAFNHIDIKIFNNTEPYEVTPALLLRSIKLKEFKI